MPIWHNTVHTVSEEVAVPFGQCSALWEKAWWAPCETAGLHGVIMSHLSSPGAVNDGPLWCLVLCRTVALQSGCSSTTLSFHVDTGFGKTQTSFSAEVLKVNVLHFASVFVLHQFAVVAGLLKGFWAYRPLLCGPTLKFLPCKTDGWTDNGWLAEHDWLHRSIYNSHGSNNTMTCLIKLGKKNTAVPSCVSG